MTTELLGYASGTSLSRRLRMLEWRAIFKAENCHCLGM